ncbi:hypothetical protein CCH79_00001356 [Gambusia affinis]|uniref:Ig-like domain-containing protein n=1 Tax=Gambusia affinis TaxID=33528 RepID=A0A315VRE1_GAMAF|nr:hypothetical protein CCH79_00001356 [Gambusia affinis]
MEVVYFLLTSRWFCEGKELENSPDIQIITSGELHSLVIAEAFEEDTGRYSCFASNVYGTDSTSAEIYVEGEAHVYLKQGSPNSVLEGRHPARFSSLLGGTNNLFSMSMFFLGLLTNHHLIQVR